MTTYSVYLQQYISAKKSLVGAYVLLLLFMVVYCARPEDWIPGLSAVPLAKITGVLALLSLVLPLGRIRQRLPREVLCLVLLIGQLLLASVLSPVWRGGAVQTTLDFAKVLVIVVVMAVAVNTSKRLRLLILIQAASVAVIAVVTVLKGHLIAGRLEGVLSGNYSNPNDLSLAIVISLPLCLASLFLSRRKIGKAAWALSILVMVYAVFLTGSRAGFLSLVITAAVLLWEFAIRGHRRYLVALALLVGGILWQSSSGMLSGRLNGIFGQNTDPVSAYDAASGHDNVWASDTASAYESSQQRQQLFWRSVSVTEQHPLFGVGPGNFVVVSGNWHVAHNSFTEMSSEAGVPAFLLYVFILWSGLRNLSMIKRLARGSTEAILLTRALRASLGGYVVGSLFASTEYQFFPYFLVAYTTALVWIVKRSAVRSKPSDLGQLATSDTNNYCYAARPKMSWQSS